MDYSPLRLKLFSFFKPMGVPCRTVLFCDDDKVDKVVQTPGSENVCYRLYELMGPAGIRGCFMVPMIVSTEGLEEKGTWLTASSAYEAPIKAIDRFLRKSKLRYKLLTDFSFRSLEECRSEIREMVDGM